MGIILPTIRTSQPQQPASIDWGNPITRGLVFAGIGGQRYQYVNKKLISTVDGTMSLKGKTSRGDSGYYNQAEDTSDLTIIAGVYLTSNNGDYGAFEYGYYVSAGDNSNRGFGLSGAGNNIYIANRRDSGAITDVKAVSLPYIGVFGYSGSGGQTCTWYENGAAGGTVAWSGAAWAADGRKTAKLAVSSSTGKGAFFQFQWNRVLSADEHKSIAANPWQVFAPQPRKLWVVPAGGINLAGGGADTAAATGALTTGIPISAAALTIATTTGQLSTGINIAGVAADVSAASGALTTNISLSGSALDQAIASAALSAGIILTAGAVAQSAANGQLDALINLIAAASDTATASGALTASGSGLSGDAVGLSSATGAVTAQIKLNAAAVAQAAAAGGLNGGASALSGNAQAQSTAPADLTATIQLSSQALAQAITNGSMVTSVRLVGAAIGAAFATGDLSTVSSIPAQAWKIYSMPVDIRAVNDSYASRVDVQYIKNQYAMAVGL